MTGVWAIDGVDVPASVARALAYVAIGGADGVIEPEGLRVEPLAVPGGAVRVMPGAASILNRYPNGGSLQAYPIYEQVAQQVTIAPTTSAGARTDLVIARVYDPNFETVPEGMAGARFEVIQGVPPETGDWFAASLPYPALVLAQVNVPASTATITAGMIRDLRRLARPRSAQEMLMHLVQAGALTSTAKTALWDWAPQVRVPSWATHAHVVATLGGVRESGDTSGYLDVRLGSLVSQDMHYDTELAAGVDARSTYLVLGGWPLPAAVRGTVQPVRMFGSRVAGKPGHISFTATHVGLDVRFSEQAVS